MVGDVHDFIEHVEGVAAAAGGRDPLMDRIIALLRQIPQWQPIATAPKDGTLVLLWWRSYARRDTVDYWACGCWREFGDGSCGWVGESFHASEHGYWTRLIGERPTHWMPLPAPPVVKDE